jgi:MYXO-CTERM domain-containing protein
MKKLKFMLCAGLLCGTTVFSLPALAQTKDSVVTTTARTTHDGDHDDTGKWGLLGLLGLLGLAGLRRRDHNHTVIEDRTRLTDNDTTRRGDRL